MIWKDLPAWIIVDHDFHEFLKSLDNRRIGEVINSQQRWKENRKEIQSLLRQLLPLGLLLSNPTITRQLISREKTVLEIENITWNATAKCNLKCPFCYNADCADSPKVEAVSGKEIIQFLSGMKPYLATHPSFFILGGEPLLAIEKVFTVASKAKELGFSVLLSTNGILLTAEIAKTAAKIGMKVQISVDGPDLNSHEAIRGKATFQRCLDGIHLLQKNGVHTIMSMVCHRGNLHQLEDYYKLAHSLNVQEARFIPLRRLGRAAKGHFTPPSMLEMVNAAASLFRSRPDLIYLVGSDFLSTLAGTCRLSAKRFSCGTGKQTLLLDSDGSLYPCLNCAYPIFRIANICEKDFNFPQSWESNSGLNGFRNETRLDSPHRKCNDCIVKFWCLGGCRGEMYSNAGDHRAIPDNCQDIIDAFIETMWLIPVFPWLGKSRPHRC